MALANHPIFGQDGIGKTCGHAGTGLSGGSFPVVSASN